MSIRLSHALCLLSLLTLGACSLHFGAKHTGSGVLGTATRECRTFDEIEALGSIDIVVRIGDTHSVVVTGDDNLIEYVLTEVKGDRLHIRLDNGSYNLNKPLIVTVTLPALEHAQLTGSGDVSITGLEQDSISLVVVGSGDVTASGRVNDLEAHVTGSGDMELRGLRARSVEATVQGSGDLSLTAEEKLNASVQGSGDIDYWGGPQDLEKVTRGSGSITGH